METISTKAMDLSYNDNVLTLKIRQHAVIDQEDIYEFFGAAKDLIKNDRFVVLTDGRAEHLIVQAAQEALHKFHNPNRLANAIVTGNELTEKRVSSFIQSQAGYSPMRQFKTKEAALSWLKEQLKRAQRADEAITVMIFPEVKCTEHFQLPAGCAKFTLTGLTNDIQDLEIATICGDQIIRKKIASTERSVTIGASDFSRFWFEYATSEKEHKLQMTFHVN
jgi:hypothetical protein